MRTPRIIDEALELAAAGQIPAALERLETLAATTPHASLGPIRAALQRLADNDERATAAYAACLLEAGGADARRDALARLQRLRGADDRSVRGEALRLIGLDQLGRFGGCAAREAAHALLRRAIHEGSAAAAYDLAEDVAHHDGETASVELLRRIAHDGGIAEATLALACQMSRRGATAEICIDLLHIAAQRGLDTASDALAMIEIARRAMQTGTKHASAAALRIANGLGLDAATAQQLLARMHGHENWTAAVAALASGQPLVADEDCQPTTVVMRRHAQVRLLVETYGLDRNLANERIDAIRPTATQGRRARE